MSQVTSGYGSHADGVPAPGSCADCEGDAFIRMGGSDGSQEMLCAHCYAERTRSGKTAPVPRSSRASARTQ